MQRTCVGRVVEEWNESTSSHLVIAAEKDGIPERVTRSVVRQRISNQLGDKLQDLLRVWLVCDTEAQRKPSTSRAIPKGPYERESVPTGSELDIGGRKGIRGISKPCSLRRTELRPIEEREAIRGIRIPCSLRSTDLKPIAERKAGDRRKVDMQFKRDRTPDTKRHSDTRQEISGIKSEARIAGQSGPSLNQNTAKIIDPIYRRHFSNETLADTHTHTRAKKVLQRKRLSHKRKPI